MARRATIPVRFIPLRHGLALAAAWVAAYGGWHAALTVYVVAIAVLCLPPVLAQGGTSWWAPRVGFSDSVKWLTGAACQFGLAGAMLSAMFAHDRCVAAIEQAGGWWGVRYASGRMEAVASFRGVSSHLKLRPAVVRRRPR